MLSRAILGFALAGLSVTQVRARTTYAVFVGINDYIEFTDEPGGDLLGAEHDARAMREVLLDRWGLEPSNALTLLGREATKNAIHEAIVGWLAPRAQPGDLTIFYFAGHGSQVYDLDGDEPDGLDETLAPVDVLPLSSVNDIRDDEFRAWLSAIRTDVVVILDSCHSGTATRASGVRTRTLDRAPPPEGGRAPTTLPQRSDRQAMADSTVRVLELAGAAPHEAALEGPLDDAPGAASEEHGGMFTRYLVGALRRAAPSATYEDVLRDVAERLEYEELGQSPQITGEGAKALFAPPGR
ncbi:MAG: caspase family protein [Gemmatimonadetes bacterium]|nr:caspase family protein [Gemmatimonadota bacterium]